uniref:VWFD domain-containing protein n=1 Tax=Fundulus heteroclitus TaxID=8078 RepID=A0A3Q2SUZ5_FUNHE
SHINQFCSTWGNFHYKTLDGYFFQLPSTCNYILTSQCKSSYESFNIQLQRQESKRLSCGLCISSNCDCLFFLSSVTLPFSQGGISIEETMSYIKVEAKLGLVLMWNQKDSLWVELDAKFKNQTCGLCGDFNEIKLYDEFIQSGNYRTLNSDEYAEKWKIDGPTETCNTNVCKNLLEGPALRSCGSFIDTESFIKACARDLCTCKTNDSTCLCSTVSEYSRQCAHAGGHPQQWKTKQLCEKTCPFNMEYKECGSPCTDTCRYRHRKQLCDEHCIDGCFCPPGTVFNDISQSGCVPVEQCPCFHKAQTYNSGESVMMASCYIILNCPAICSIRGGSHFSTFDDNAYTFHGKYNSLKCGTFTVLGDFDKCERSEKSTCLSAVTLLYQNQTVKYFGECEFKR